MGLFELCLYFFFIPLTYVSLLNNLFLPSFLLPPPSSFLLHFLSTLLSVVLSLHLVRVCLSVYLSAPFVMLCPLKFFYLIFYCSACIYLILLLNFLIIRRSFFPSNSLPYFLPQHSPFLLPFFHLLNLTVIAGPCWSSLVLCFPFPCPLPSLVQVMFPCLL